MKILAFESSCDETAVAVVEDGRKVLSDAIASQVDIHAIYGGVVPEIASRKHVEAIAALTEKALADAGCTRPDRRSFGGTELCKVCCLRIERSFDSRASYPGPHCRQLSGLSGSGAAISGVGHFRRQYSDHRCGGLHPHDDPWLHPGRCGGGVF